MPHTSAQRRAGSLWRLCHRLSGWARRLRDDVMALALARHDPRLPWQARLLALAVVAYALSPIDLIPDIIPVLGQIDELVILPLGIAMAVRLIPPSLLAELRARTRQHRPAGLIGLAGAAVIIALWGLAVTLAFGNLLN